MLGAKGHSFRLFFFVEFAFAIGLLIATFFLVPETMYKRTVRAFVSNSVNSSTETLPEKHAAVSAQPTTTSHPNTAEVTLDSPTVSRSRRSYLSELKPWSGIDREASFFGIIGRSITFFLVPQVVWVITSFGIYIGCAALAFNYTFPIKIVQPPYLWDQVSLTTYIQTCTSHSLITIPD